MKFFDYCFYRIHYWYLKRKIDTHPRVYSSNWVSFGEICNILIFIQLFLFLFKIQCKILFVAIPLYIIIYGMNYFVLLTTKKYEKLLEKYEDETYKMLKGWGVVLYLVGSLALFIVSLFVFKVFN